MTRGGICNKCVQFWCQSHAHIWCWAWFKWSWTRWWFTNCHFHQAHASPTVWLMKTACILEGKRCSWSWRTLEYVVVLWQDAVHTTNLCACTPVLLDYNEKPICTAPSFKKSCLANEVASYNYYYYIQPSSAVKCPGGSFCPVDSLIWSLTGSAPRPITSREVCTVCTHRPHSGCVWPRKQWNIFAEFIRKWVINYTLAGRSEKCVRKRSRADDTYQRRQADRTKSQRAQRSYRVPWPIWQFMSPGRTIIIIIILIIKACIVLDSAWNAFTALNIWLMTIVFCTF